MGEKRGNGFLFILEFFCDVWQCCGAVSWREGWTNGATFRRFFLWSVALASSAIEVAHAALVCFVVFFFQWSDCLAGFLTWIVIGGRWMDNSLCKWLIFFEMRGFHLWIFAWTADSGSSALS